MRKSSLVLSTLLLCSPVSSYANDDLYSTCAKFSKQAEAVMRLRQDGVRMREVVSMEFVRIDARDIDESIKPKAKTIAEIIIVDAFKTPLKTTKADKDVIVVEYGNATYSSCLKEFKVFFK